MTDYINSEVLKPNITVAGYSINHIDYRKPDNTIISVNIKNQKITKKQTDGNEEEIQPDNAKEAFAVAAKEIELIYRPKHARRSNLEYIVRQREIRNLVERRMNLELWNQ